MTTRTLETIRSDIDDVDAGLLRLLNRRAALSIEVGELKRAESDAPSYFRPEREAALLERLCTANPGPLPADDLLAVYREILESSRAVQLAGERAAGGEEDADPTGGGEVPKRLQALAFEGVRSLEPYEPGKPEEELRRELGLNRIVKLASNENPLGPGARAAAAVAECAPHSHRYPDGNGFALKQALGRRLNVDVSQITLGNGSDNIFELVARTFLGPGREAVYSQHGFAMYPIVTKTAGARGVEVPARSWGHDLEAMRASVGPRTAVVFIANPNNPTGTWTSSGEIVPFLERLPPTVLVVLDEAYREYVEAPGYPDGIALAARHPNLLVTRTFSKVHGLGGLRVGYAVSHPALADLLNRARSPFNVSRPAQAAAIAALADDEHVRRSRELNAEGMAQLVRAFDALGLEHIPSLGNFVCVRVPGGGAAMFRALLARGVIVRALDGYGMSEHLRVTIGTREENEFFLSALRAELNGR